MSQTEFADIKEELTKTVQEILNSDLEDKTKYEHEKAQEKTQNCFCPYYDNSLYDTCQRANKAN